MKKAEKRRQVLRQLIKETAGGNAEKFCAMHKLNPIFVRALIKEGSLKAFGERAARKLEAQIGLPPEFLDTGEAHVDDSFGQIKALLEQADFLTPAQKQAHISLIQAAWEANKE